MSKHSEALFLIELEKYKNTLFSTVLCGLCLILQLPKVPKKKKAATGHGRFYFGFELNQLNPCFQFFASPVTNYGVADKGEEKQRMLLLILPNSTHY